MDQSPTTRPERLLEVLVSNALAALRKESFPALPEDVPVTIEQPKKPEFGDWSCTVALQLAKIVDMPPMEFASRVVDMMEGDRSPGPAIAAMTVTHPGFINFRLTDEFLVRACGEMAASERLGIPAPARHETVVIDYSAPNVAKEMHIGHIRSTIIGDSLARIYGFLGHRVVRENHIGDWGTPFGMLIEHLVDEGETEQVQHRSLEELGAFYREARKKFDTDDAFKKRSRERVVELQRGDPETLRLWRILVDASIDTFEDMYHRLDILLTRDDVRGESAYNPMLEAVVEDLGALGLLTESEGAKCVFPDGFTNRDGSPLPLIVRKTDGGYGYAASDLASIRDRVDRLHADRMLYVVGMPQAQHFAMCFAVARMAGWLPDSVEAFHVSFGNILGPDHKMFKSRTGDSVSLTELITEAVERGEAVFAGRCSDIGTKERENIAHAIGIAAIKYADLSNDRIRDYVFDLDRMVAFDGNTGPYLQYAHARILSIFRKAEWEPGMHRGPVAVKEGPERSLALQALRFPAVLEEAASAYKPHILCTYLFELATAFTSFYEQCPILRAPDAAIRDARLELSFLTARVLNQGLALLGIECPPRM